MSMWRHPVRSRAIALIWVALTALLMATMTTLSGRRRVGGRPRDSMVGGAPWWTDVGSMRC